MYVPGRDHAENKERSHQQERERERDAAACIVSRCDETPLRATAAAAAAVVYINGDSDAIVRVAADDERRVGSHYSPASRQ